MLRSPKEAAMNGKRWMTVMMVVALMVVALRACGPLGGSAIGRTPAQGIVR